MFFFKKKTEFIRSARDETKHIASWNFFEQL